MKKLQHSREGWLTEAAALIKDELFAPYWPIRESMKLKISVGFAPNRKADTKTIGVCLSSVCSEGGYNEIFISPSINDSLLVLATLVHEIIHAIDDCTSGHKGDFLRLMKISGLEGKPTATIPSEKLIIQLDDYINLLGDIPHDRVSLGSTKRQVGRNLKVSCETCCFKFNTSRSQIDFVLADNEYIECPSCHEEMTVND